MEFTHINAQGEAYNRFDVSVLRFRFTGEF